MTSFTPQRMSFGIFMAPFHRVGENPTLAMERDLDLIEHLDRLGYDEAWIGEHHSGARELIGEPMLTIAAASQRTKNIRLGTGVTSLPYHNPFMVADRLVQLDHMTRGRVMLGCGPGLLTSDAYMLGIDPRDQRPRMGESLDVIMALLRGETVSASTEWFTLNEARLQMAPYTFPRPPISVATSFTPSGPLAAGKHGLGLLSVAGSDNEAFSKTWGWVEEAAEEHGKAVSRSEWKVVVTMHLAESREQAIKDLEHGYPRRAYAGDRSPTAAGGPGGGFGPTAASVAEAVDSGQIIAGDPDVMIAKIEEIQERSGGVGGILALAHEWAGQDATLRSYELFARYVMPRFQGQLDPLLANREWFEGEAATIFRRSGAASVKAFEDAGKALPPALQAAVDARAAAKAAKEQAAPA